MKKELMFAYYLNDEKEKANAAGYELEKRGDLVNADKYYMRALAFSDALHMAELLLKSANGSNHTGCANSANMLLGECAG